MSTKTQALVGIILLIILFALYFVSLLGLKWLSFQSRHMGLWYECTPLDGCKVMEFTPSHDVPFLDWYSSVRAFIMLAIIFDFLAISAALLNLKYPLSFKVRPMRICCVFNVIFLFFAVIVFGIEKRNIFNNEWSLDWTYYFTCANLILTFFVAVYYLFVVKDRSLRKFQIPSTNTAHQPVPTYTTTRNDVTHNDNVRATTFMQQQKQDRVETQFLISSSSNDTKKSSEEEYSDEDSYTSEGETSYTTNKDIQEMDTFV